LHPKYRFLVTLGTEKKNDFLNIEVGFTVVCRHTFSSSVCAIGSQELLNCVFLTRLSHLQLQLVRNVISE